MVPINQWASGVLWLQPLWGSFYISFLSNISVMLQKIRGQRGLDIWVQQSFVSGSAQFCYNRKTFGGTRGRAT
jgi:hypothetical protein